jgi:phage terminase small subunit
MSRHKKPEHLKIISGTSRPSGDKAPAIDLPLVDSVPNPPDWLPNAHAVTEWKRLAPILHANKLLTEACLTTLGHLCALHGKMAQLYAAGESPTGHMAAQYRGLANDFGLTAVAIGKVKPTGDSIPKGNKFANNGKPGA